MPTIQLLESPVVELFVLFVIVSPPCYEAAFGSVSLVAGADAGEQEGPTGMIGGLHPGASCVPARRDDEHGIGPIDMRRRDCP